ncbi:MAG: SCO1664 family protein [Thermomicrobiales bacterium]
MPDLHLRIERDEDDAKAAPAPLLSEEESLELMERAAITDAKLIPWGSNYTFAVALDDEEHGDRLAIYKPRRGESPLWDFASGTLYRREHAAYRVNRRLGWSLVPPTIVRDGPHGIGSLQLYVEPKEPDEESGDDVLGFWSAQRIEIERMVLFDHITNNADRKLSHCLRGVDDQVWGIDHGLTFNVEPKLRTVLWQYVDQPISAELLMDLGVMMQAEVEFRQELAADLQTDEVEETVRRVSRLLSSGRYPRLDPRSNVPYGWW